ncbi:hypothetical protein GWK47_024085 [Chionoecetes opilio]|uniref:C3H1-type domain-containing protein n=1 Tax=Chionoecetes opilio TaxID=41210 RepID=A0A8J4XLW3_CHIOP|nr:hypothetical protein GWK47_024085 [Chionoecetes opilio]
MENLPPPDTYCAICNKQCLLECLNCQKCKNYIHADCSNLPAYAIVNFFNTRCQYTCEECARKQLGEDCDRSFAQVYAILEKEREVKQQQRLEQEGAVNAVSDVDDEINELDNENKTGEENNGPNEPSSQNQNTKHSTGKQGNTQTTAGNGNQASDQRKEKVCYYYKNNKCKYGLRGRDCPNAHPRLCTRYIVNGCEPVRGCKKGKDCVFLHPPICYGSERKRECLNMECKRLHLKGTRRYPPYDHQTTEQQTRQQAAPAKQLPAWSTIPPSTPNPHNAWESGPPHQTEKQQNATTQSFLLQQMQQMQQVQQHILQMLKAVPWQWGPTQPLQGYQQQQVAAMPTAFIK